MKIQLGFITSRRIEDTKFIYPQKTQITWSTGFSKILITKKEFPQITAIEN